MILLLLLCLIHISVSFKRSDDMMVCSYFTDPSYYNPTSTFGPACIDALDGSGAIFPGHAVNKWGSTGSNCRRTTNVFEFTRSEVRSTFTINGGGTWLCCFWYILVSPSRTEIQLQDHENIGPFPFQISTAWSGSGSTQVLEGRWYSIASIENGVVHVITSKGGYGSREGSKGRDWYEFTRDLRSTFIPIMESEELFLAVHYGDAYGKDNAYIQINEMRITEYGKEEEQENEFLCPADYLPALSSPSINIAKIEFSGTDFKMSTSHEHTLGETMGYIISTKPEYSFVNKTNDYWLQQCQEGDRVINSVGFPAEEFLIRGTTEEGTYSFNAFMNRTVIRKFNDLVFLEDKYTTFYGIIVVVDVISGTEDWIEVRPSEKGNLVIYDETPFDENTKKLDINFYFTKHYQSSYTNIAFDGSTYFSTNEVTFTKELVSGECPWGFWYCDKYKMSLDLTNYNGCEFEDQLDVSTTISGEYENKQGQETFDLSSYICKERSLVTYEGSSEITAYYIEPKALIPVKITQTATISPCDVIYVKHTINSNQNIDDVNPLFVYTRMDGTNTHLVKDSQITSDGMNRKYEIVDTPNPLFPNLGDHEVLYRFFPFTSSECTRIHDFDMMTIYSTSRIKFTDINVRRDGSNNNNDQKDQLKLNLYFVKEGSDSSTGNAGTNPNNNWVYLVTGIGGGVFGTMLMLCLGFIGCVGCISLLVCFVLGFVVVGILGYVGLHTVEGKKGKQKNRIFPSMEDNGTEKEKNDEEFITGIMEVSEMSNGTKC